MQGISFLEGNMDNLSILSNTLRIFGLAFIFIIPIMKLDLFGG